MAIRILCAVLCLFLLFPCSAQGAPENTPTVSAAGAVLIEAETGKIIFEKDAFTKRGMASTTKIMTALLAIREAQDLDAAVTVHPQAVGIEGSSVYLYEGEKITLRHLLYALMLASANDAAAAIAIALSGSIDAFVEKMNDLAEELGLQDTQFRNPHGLDAEGHYTTPYDLAILSAYAMQDETFRQIVSTKSIVIPLHDGSTSRLLTNHNRLVRQDERVCGIKTGYTRACGRCLVSAAEQNGVSVIAVTIDAPDDWNDHRKMHDYAFAHLERVTLAKEGQLSTSIPVTGGEEDSVNAINVIPFARSLPKGEQPVTVKYETNCFLYAPVTKGQICGEAILLIDGEEVGRMTLYAERSVAQKKEKKEIWFIRLWNWFVSLF